MDVQFIATTSGKLSELPIVNGQLIYLIDRTATYYDVANSRRLISSMQIVSSLPSTSVAQEGVIYGLVNADGNVDATVWDANASTYRHMTGYVATTSTLGLVKPDGTTITIDANGVISSHVEISSLPASSVTYDNSTSGLSATVAQAAIDEIKQLSDDATASASSALSEAQLASTTATAASEAAASASTAAASALEAAESASTAAASALEAAASASTAASSASEAAASASTAAQQAYDLAAQSASVVQSYESRLQAVEALASTISDLAAVCAISLTTEVKSAPVKSAHIYGAEWDGTSTTQWTRTDDSATFVDPVPAVNNGTGSSPFDNCSPWKDIKRQTSANSGEVVYIPKFWVKITTPSSGSGLKIQIADKETDGFVPAPAFQDRGDGRGELDYILVGRYHCASDFKSETGVKPHGNITRSAFRTGVYNLGTDVYQWDYAVRLTLFYLYLVEFANWDSQATIGYGCGNGSSTENMGATDAMQYHTGTASASRTTYGVGVQYRYIEGLWDNVCDYVDGIYYSGTDVYIVKNPENFSDTSNGTKIGTKPATNNFISAFFLGTGEYAAFIHPSAANGSSDTYVCDYYNYNSSYTTMYAGGDYYELFARSGLFRFASGHTSATSAARGSRLMELPSIPQ